MPARRFKVETTLALSHSVEVNKTAHLYVTQTWSTLRHSVDQADIITTVHDTLNLTQAVSHNQVWAEASSQLNLTQSVDTLYAIPRSVTSQLNLVQSLDNSIKYAEASSQLTLTQVADVRRPVPLTASNSLSEATFTNEELLTLSSDELLALAETRVLRQSVTVRRSITNISIVHNLQLTQSTARTIPLTVSNHLSLTHTADTVAAYENVSSQLYLQQTVSVDRQTPASNTLELTQSVVVNGIFNRSLTSTIIFTQSVTTTDYTAPVLVTSSNILLTHPYVSPTFSLIMKTPEFNNVEQLEFRRINRRTRGHTLEVMRDSNWPKAERLIFKFAGLTEEKAKELLSFYDQSLGDEIGLLDHESRQWRGILLTPFERIQDQSGNSCNYSANFEFEGVVI